MPSGGALQGAGWTGFFCVRSGAKILNGGVLLGIFDVGGSVRFRSAGRNADSGNSPGGFSVLPEFSGQGKLHQLQVGFDVLAVSVALVAARAGDLEIPVFKKLHHGENAGVDVAGSK